MADEPVLRANHLVPHPDRFDATDPANQSAMAAHDAAVAAGHGGYLDPATGLFVMTALGLANRGTCCSNGCRHCPFVI
ncbi:MAG: DUF5522 domain-containing protein [Acidimicrobiales bacterium]